jgi:bile acid:Na+ symporter, BASS family
MNGIDNMILNFDPNQRWILNILMGFLMFGIALDIKISDFQYLLKHPKPAIVGLFAQLIIIPLITILAIFIFQPTHSIALGMILLSSCPGGNISNYATHIAKGNTALSITTTTIATITASVTIPLLYFAQVKILGSRLGDININISFLEMLRVVSSIIFIPLILGIIIHVKFPLWTNKYNKIIKTFSLIIFVVFILGAIASNFKNLLVYVKHVFLITFVLNIIGMMVGYYFAIWNGLSIRDARSITFETSIHNATFGLLITFTFFNGLGGMALLIAWYGIWDMISSLVLAKYWENN